MKLFESKKKSPFRKPKMLPANYEELDKWTMPKITAEDVKGPFTEESSFATLFPKYREKYIREVWPAVQKGLAEIGIKAELDLIEGSMTVRTTKKTFDPYSIIKARDIIKLISRSVPYQVALRLLNDEVYCDIIKIKSLVANKEKFVKRRQRLIGPNGETLKALEILTDCYIMVQGSTVSVIGHFKKMKVVRRIITEIMNNTHPLYIIKELMIKRELEKDDQLKNENWERFLPKFKKINEARKKIKKTKVTKKDSEKEKATFPNPPPMRKEDIAMETGEYFLSEAGKKKAEFKRKLDKQQEIAVVRQQQREAPYVDPGVERELEKAKGQIRAPAKPANVGKPIEVDQLVKRFKIDQNLSLK